MATFDRDVVLQTARWKGDTEAQTLANFAKLDGCTRIYKVKTSAAGDYGAFYTIRGAADEDALRSTPHLHDPLIVWPPEECGRPPAWLLPGGSAGQPGASSPATATEAAKCDLCGGAATTGYDVEFQARNKLREETKLLHTDQDGRCHFQKTTTFSGWLTLRAAACDRCIAAHKRHTVVNWLVWSLIWGGVTFLGWLVMRSGLQGTKHDYRGVICPLIGFIGLGAALWEALRGTMSLRTPAFTAQQAAQLMARHVIRLSDKKIVEAKGQVSVTRLVRRGSSPPGAAGTSEDKVATLLNGSGGNVNTALKTALEEHASCEVVAALVKAGASVNTKYKGGYTPLWRAVLYDSNPDMIRIIALLAAAGADVNAPIDDEAGQTPLMWAAQWGHLPRIEALLKAGADVSLKNKNGQTALDLATKEGKASAVAALIAAGAKP